MDEDAYIAWLRSAYAVKAHISGPAHKGVDMSTELLMWGEAFSSTVMANGGYDRVAQLVTANNIGIV